MPFFWTYLPFFDISIDFSSVSEEVFELFCEDFFVILFAVFLPVKSPVASAVAWVAFLEVVLDAYVADFVACSRSFLLLPIFLAKDKNAYTFSNIWSVGSFE